MANKKRYKLIKALRLDKETVIPYAIYNKNKTIVFLIEVIGSLTFYMYKAKLFVDKELKQEKGFKTFEEMYTFYEGYKMNVLKPTFLGTKFYEIK